MDARVSQGWGREPAPGAASGPTSPIRSRRGPIETYGLTSSSRISRGPHRGTSFGNLVVEKPRGRACGSRLGERHAPEAAYTILYCICTPPCSPAYILQRRLVAGAGNGSELILAGFSWYQNNSPDGHPSVQDALFLASSRQPAAFPPGDRQHLRSARRASSCRPVPRFRRCLGRRFAAAARVPRPNRHRRWNRRWNRRWHRRWNRRRGRHRRRPGGPGHPTPSPRRAPPPPHRRSGFGPGGNERPAREGASERRTPAGPPQIPRQIGHAPGRPPEGAP